jgi:pimeloyl-ACP methyl ester carboxylesterase
MELFAKAHPEEVAGVVLVDPRHRDFSHACEQAGLEGCSIPEAVLRTLPEVQAHEVTEYAHLSSEIDELGAFGPYPVRVLSGTTHGFSPEVESLWESLLGSLAHEAEHGELSVFAGAGHYLQLERSDAVAQVILDLLPR